VLLAGIAAQLRRAGQAAGLDVTDAKERAEAILDKHPGSPVTAGIAAAIEAWEARPHPWGEPPTGGTVGSLTDLVGLDPDFTGGLPAADYVAQQWANPPAPDIDAERERFAAFAETEFRNGEGIAALIRQYYGREE